MGCFGSNKIKTSNPVQYDPLGRTAAGSNTGPTGGPEARSRIFSGLPAAASKAGSLEPALTGEFLRAGSDPGFDAAASLARSTIAGDYLSGSPQLDAALAGVRRRTMAESADADAALRSAYARAGLGFSTANQQASEANRAAAAARAGEAENAARLQAYLQERQYQQMAPQALATATGVPLNYLSQASGVQAGDLARLAEQGNIVSGLAGGGSVAVPGQTPYYKQGAMDYASQVMGAIGSLAGGAAAGGI